MSLKDDFNTVVAKLSGGVSQVQTLKDQLAAANAQIVTLQGQVAALQAQALDLQNQVNSSLNAADAAVILAELNTIEVNLHALVN